MQDARRCRHVDLEAGVLHVVEREVLDACDHVLLESADGRRTELTDVDGILAVRLLCPTPRRVVQQVDADAADEVGALHPAFCPHCLADALFELAVPRRAARHRDGEARGRAERDPRGPSVKRTPGRPARSISPPGYGVCP